MFIINLRVNEFYQYVKLLIQKMSDIGNPADLGGAPAPRNHIKCGSFNVIC